MNLECLTVSVPEAGRLLGYSRNTTYEAIQRGELPVIRLGRKIRVPLAAIDRMLSCGLSGAEVRA
jgi:excisionase family DNA binding protein